MKRYLLLAVFALGSTGGFAPCSFSQGNLAPPGNPTPTMKSLDQIASTGKAINLTNTPGDNNHSYIISSPGSYYLGPNATFAAGKNGIFINSDNVSINLNGFAVVCPVNGVNPLSGILDSGGHRNVSVSDGTVRGWGTANISLNSNNVELRHLRLTDGTGNGGTDFSGDGFNGRACANARVVDCIASGNAGDGFAISENGVVTACVASRNSLSGFSGYNATFTDCVSNANGGFGYFLFSGVVTHCIATGNNIQGTGFFCSTTSVVTGCQANGNIGPGFRLNVNCSAMNCVSSGNGGDGFSFASNNFLSNNVATANTLNGFLGTGTNNRLDSNHAIGNTAAGIHPSSGSADFVIRNTAYANNPNYSPLSGLYIGPTTGTPSSATSPWANF